jgi:hypothetical protein
VISANTAVATGLYAFNDGISRPIIVSSGSAKAHIRTLFELSAAAAIRGLATTDYLTGQLTTRCMMALAEPAFIELWDNDIDKVWNSA